MKNEHKIKLVLCLHLPESFGAYDKKNPMLIICRSISIIIGLYFAENVIVTITIKWRQINATVGSVIQTG